MTNTTTTTRIWSNYVLESARMIGRVGRRSSGSHTHLLFVEYVVGVVDETIEPASGTIGRAFLRSGVKQIFSAGAPCNSNGQRVGSPTADLTAENLDQVTCSSCRKSLGLPVAEKAPVVDAKEVGWTVENLVTSNVTTITLQPVKESGFQTIVLVYPATGRKSTISGKAAKIEAIAAAAAAKGIAVGRNYYSPATEAPVVAAPVAVEAPVVAEAPVPNIAAINSLAAEIDRLTRENESLAIVGKALGIDNDRLEGEAKAAGAKISKLEAAVYVLAQRLQLAGIEAAIPASEIDAATIALSIVRANRRIAERHEAMISGATAATCYTGCGRNAADGSTACASCATRDEYEAKGGR